MKLWRGYILIAVFLFVCLSVNKFQPNGCTDLDAIFAKMVAYSTGSTPNEINEIWSKVKVFVTKKVCQNDEKKSLKIRI